MIHYGTYRGAVVGLRGAVVGVRGAAVGVRGAAVGNIGIPTYVISRGAVVRQPLKRVLKKVLFKVNVGHVPLPPFSKHNRLFDYPKNGCVGVRLFTLYITHYHSS